ncbi:MAG TPA: RNA-binding cell elongation regulator Jag/EloR [Candidatus Binataceae bacterium]|nr:RNA-binding cell elongation regulator Jag/EloR [Candidatus Binataceae bacterium]
MSSSDSIETTAPTIEEAITQALEQLGAHQDDVSIEVLSTPRGGVLGLGARQARVRVTRRAPEGARSGVTSPPPAPPLKRPERPAPRPPKPSPPPPEAAKRPPEPAPAIPPRPRPDRAAVAETEVIVAEVEVERTEAAEGGAYEDDTRPTASAEDQAREATALLTRILELMGERAEIELVRDSDPETMELNIKGDGSGLLIGRHGQTLDALEYVVNRVLARKIKDAAPISIDTESYRARRRQQLHRMALSKGEQAKREHVAVTLEPMPPRDRRIIHLALKDDPLITTRSSGEGFLRSIQIVPMDERREGGGRGRNERTRERDRDRGPVGQQGGFKHGQKRIV